MCAFFISVPISRDKTLINCFNERDLLTYFLSFFLFFLTFFLSFFLSFFLTFLLTSSPPLDYKVGLCNQKVCSCLRGFTVARASTKDLYERDRFAVSVSKDC